MGTEDDMMEGLARLLTSDGRQSTEPPTSVLLCGGAPDVCLAVLQRLRRLRRLSAKPPPLLLFADSSLSAHNLPALAASESVSLYNVPLRDDAATARMIIDEHCTDRAELLVILEADDLASVGSQLQMIAELAPSSRVLLLLSQSSEYHLLSLTAAQCGFTLTDHCCQFDRQVFILLPMPACVIRHATSTELVSAEKSRRLAILGAALKLPGSVDNLLSLADIMESGRDVISTVPSARRALQPVSHMFGGFLQDPDRFDAVYFDISAGEAVEIDPQLRLMLMSSVHALQTADTHVANMSIAAKVGVFVGSCSSGYAHLLTAEQFQTAASLASCSPVLSASRLSYHLLLSGPSTHVDTGNSAGLTAVHLASESISMQLCSVALIAASAIHLSPVSWLEMARRRVLSASNRCQSFDADADGLVRGEAVVTLVVASRLSGCSQQGGILAMLECTASGQGSSLGGATLHHEALQKAGLNGMDINYVDAYATGDPLRDQAEWKSLVGNSECGRKLVVGASKAQFGHTEAACGLVGLLRALVVHRQNRVTAQLHWKLLCTKQQQLDVSANTVVSVNSCGNFEYSFVNSFGNSGSNAAAILSACTAVQQNLITDKLSSFDLCDVQLLSAKSAKSIESLERLITTHLKECHARSSFAENQLNCNNNFMYQKAILTNLNERKSHGIISDGVEVSKLAYVVSGHGSHYENMGKELYRTDNTFSLAMNECFDNFSVLTIPDLREAVYPSKSGFRLLTGVETHWVYPQLSIFSVQYALSRLLRRFSLSPDYIIGHSVGEYCAAQVCGMLSLQSACLLSALSNKIFFQANKRGEIIVVNMSSDQMGLILKNSTSSLAIAGVVSVRNSVEQIGVSIEGRNVATEFKRVLKFLGHRCVSFADRPGPVHSWLLEPHVEQFRAVAETVDYEAARIPLISTLTGEVVTQIDANYWCEQSINSVRFEQAIERSAQLGCDAFLEVSAHPILISSAKVTASQLGNQALFLATLQRGESDSYSLLNSLTRLHLAGATVDWSYLNVRTSSCPHTPIEYPFDTTSYWIEDDAPEKAQDTRRDSKQKTAKGTDNQLTQIDDITDHIRECLSKLTHLRTEDIQADAGFMSLGLDSFKATTFIDEIKRHLQIPQLSLTALFQHSTLNRLACHIQGELFGLSESVKEDSPAGVIDSVAVIARKQQAEDVLLFGMSCRMPKCSDSLSSYWDCLKRGVSAISEIPTERLRHLRPADYEHVVNLRTAGFLHGSIQEFDAAFFNLSSTEALCIDPQHRVFLECAIEAFQQSGVDPTQLDGSSVGVFGAVYNHDYLDEIAASADADTLELAHLMHGCVPSHMSGRLAYFLGLHGPSLGVDAACAASLVALNLGRQSVRSGECASAVVGGVNLMISPHITIRMSRFGVFSPDCHCKSFDADADGTVRADGCSAVIVGSPSTCWLRGARGRVAAGCTMSDGASTQFTAPNPRAQAKLLATALGSADVSPDRLAFAEAHGTATRLGDPIEANVLNEQMTGTGGVGHLYLGTAKTYVGHTETAAGLAGLLKLSATLNHHHILQSLHFKLSNPEIYISGSSPLVIPVGGQEAPSSKAATAIGLVSSFGATGTISNAIVTSTHHQCTSPQDELTAAMPRLLQLSAKTQPALHSTAALHAEYYQQNCRFAPGAIKYFRYRRCVYGSNDREIHTALNVSLSAKQNENFAYESSAAFLFTGQGLQHVNMGKELYNRSTFFRAQLDKLISLCDDLLEVRNMRPLREMLYPTSEDQEMSKRLFIKDGIYATLSNVIFQIALARYWLACNLAPKLMIGHSLGELSAAVVGGAYSDFDGIRLACARGIFLSKHFSNTLNAVQMAVVIAPRAILQLTLDSFWSALSNCKIEIAAINSPNATAIVGTMSCVMELVEQFRFMGHTRTRCFNPVGPGHTSFMKDVDNQDFLRVCSSLEQRQSTLPIACTVSAKIVHQFSDNFWFEQLLKPVDFVGAVDLALAKRCNRFIEIGFHPTLGPLLEESLPKQLKNVLSVYTLHRSTSDCSAFMNAFGELYTAGCNLSLIDSACFEASVTSIPTYAFQRQRVWLLDESKKVKTIKRTTAANVAAHALLGTCLTTEMMGCAEIGERFNLTVSQGHGTQYLLDHAVYGISLFPGIGYIEQALEYAGSRSSFDGCLTIDSINIIKPLFLNALQQSIVFSVCRVEMFSDVKRTFFVYSSSGEEEAEKWSLCACGELQLQASNSTPTLPQQEQLDKLPVQASVPNYSTLKQVGLDYGTSFQTAKYLWTHGDRILMQVMQTANDLDMDGYVVHPTLLDGVMQALPFYLQLSQKSHMLPIMPISFTHIQFEPFSISGRLTYGLLQLSIHDDTVNHLSVALYSDSGRQVGRLGNVVVRTATIDRLKGILNKEARESSLNESDIALYQLCWQSVEFSDVCSRNTRFVAWLCDKTNRHLEKVFGQRLNHMCAPENQFQGDSLNHADMVFYFFSEPRSLHSTQSIRQIRTVFNLLKDNCSWLSMVFIMPLLDHGDVHGVVESPLHGFIKSINKELTEPCIRMLFHDETCSIFHLVSEVSLLSFGLDFEEIVMLRNGQRYCLRLENIRRNSNNAEGQIWVEKSNRRATSANDEITSLVKAVYISSANGQPVFGICCIAQHAMGDVTVDDFLIALAPNISSLALVAPTSSVVLMPNSCSIAEAAMLAAACNETHYCNASSHVHTQMSLERHRCLFVELLVNLPVRNCQTLDKLEQVCPAGNIERQLLYTAIIVPTMFHGDILWAEQMWCVVCGSVTGVTRAVVDYLASLGVRNVASLSRTAITNTFESFQLSSFKLDISSKIAITAALNSLPTGSKTPIVIHSAAVLNDCLFRDLTWADFDVALRPKLLGSWYVHVATMHNRSVERFMAFSSIAASFGSRAQTNYATANAFLDALVNYRRRLGLPAESIAWGAWGEVGGVTQVLLKQVKAQGVTPIPTSAAIDMLKEILLADRAHTVAACMDWGRYISLNPHMNSFLAHVQKSSHLVQQPQTDKPKQFAETVPPINTSLSPGNVQSVNRIKSIILDILERILGCKRAIIDETAGFMEMGLDSLMSIDFQKQLEKEFPEHELSTTVAYERSTVASLSAYLYQQARPDSSTEAKAMKPQPCLARTGQGASVVAIYGASCAFANTSTQLSSYWQMLLVGRDGIVHVPEHRISLQRMGAHSAGRTYKAGFLARPVDAFDAPFFSTSPLEAKFIDPQQRLMLESIWHAIEDSTIQLTVLQSAKTGVCAGLVNSDYMHLVSHSSASNMSSLTGNFFAFAAGRPAYHLGLHGSNIVLDTACSTSLAAVTIAHDSINSQKEDFMVVSTGNLLLCEELVKCSWPLVSRDYHCKPFDAAADGLTRAEGVAALLLGDCSSTKSASAYAIVSSSAVNHDGASSGLTVPNGRAQEMLIQKALRLANLRSTKVGYLESHGTGTIIGDPIESNALSNVFHSNDALCLGASKSNIGHAEASAGMAGLLKAISSLQLNTIPQQLHFHVLNDKIQLKDNQMQVAVISNNFLNYSGALIGVSSFGLSGTNAHTLISEANSQHTKVDASEQLPYSILPISAKSKAALGSAVENFQAALTAGWHSIGDVSKAVSLSRKQMKFRAAMITKASAQGRSADFELIEWSQTDSQDPSLAFVFSGQLPILSAKTGKQLYSVSSQYKSHFDKCILILDQTCESQLARLGDEPLSTWTTAQPVQFAIQYALSQHWNSWGVEPTHLLGHSFGEYAACITAGILTLADACKVVAAKGKLMDKCTGGSMLAVAAEIGTVLSILAKGNFPIDIAADNSPQQTVVSGCPEQLHEFLRSASMLGYNCTKIDISIGFHSRQLKVVEREFSAITSALHFNTATIPLYNNLTGQPVYSLSPNYFSKQMLSTVRFLPAASQLLSDGVTTCLEIGPRPVLTPILSSICQHLLKPDVALLPSWTSRQDEARTMCTSLARLFTAGFCPAFSALFNSNTPDGDSTCKFHLNTIPKYEFVHQHYWAPMRQPERRCDGASVATESQHPLLGRAVKDQSGNLMAENEISLQDARYAYLLEHRMCGRAVFPGAAYIELFVAIAAQSLRITSDDSLVCLKQVAFSSVLEVQSNTVVLMTTLSSCNKTGHYSASIASRLNAEWNVHANANLSISNEELPTATEPFNFESNIDVSQMYERYVELGIEYGSSFQTLQSIAFNGLSAAVSVQIEELVDGYLYHPTLLMGVFSGSMAVLLFQPLANGTLQIANDEICLLTYIAEYKCLPTSCNSLLAGCQFTKASPSTSEGSLEVYQTGNLKCVTMARGCMHKHVSRQQFVRTLQAATHSQVDVAVCQSDFEELGSANQPLMQTVEAIESIVEGALCQVVQLPRGAAVDKSEAFVSMGMDSMMLVDFANRLQQRLSSASKSISTAVLFEYNTVDALTSYLSDSLRNTVPGKEDSKMNKLATAHLTETVWATQTRETFEIIIPLSYPQRRLWCFNAMSADAAKHTISLECVFSKEANHAYIHCSIELLTCKQSVFRMTVVPAGGDESIPAVQVYRSSTESYHALQEELPWKQTCYTEHDRWAHQMIQLNSSNGLIRCKLLRSPFSNQKTQKLVIHHIVFDGWSGMTLFKDLASIYSVLSESNLHIPITATVDYCDFTLHQQSLVKSELIQAQLLFWKRKLDNYSELLWPTDKPCGHSRSTDGRPLLLTLPRATANAIQLRCQQEAVTMFTATFAAFCSMVCNWCHQDDFLVSTVSDNRTPETSNLIGFVSNNVVVRVDLKSKTTKNLIVETATNLMEAFRHKDIPYEYLLSELNVNPSFHTSELVQAMFIMNPSVSMPDLGAHIAQIGHSPNNVLEIDQTWHVTQQENGIVVRVKYAQQCNYLESMRAEMRSFVSGLLDLLCCSPFIANENLSIHKGDKTSQCLTCSNRDGITCLPVVDLAVVGAMSAQNQTMMNNVQWVTFSNTQSSDVNERFGFVLLTQQRNNASFLRQQSIATVNHLPPSSINIVCSGQDQGTLIRLVLCHIRAGHTVHICESNVAKRLHAQKFNSCLPFTQPRTKQHIFNSTLLVVQKHNKEYYLSSTLLLETAAIMTMQHCVAPMGQFAMLSHVAGVSAENLIFSTVTATLAGCCVVFPSRLRMTQHVRPDYAMGDNCSMESYHTAVPFLAVHLQACAQTFQAIDTAFLVNFAGGRACQYLTFDSSCSWHTMRWINGAMQQRNIGTALPTCRLTINDNNGFSCPIGVPGHLHDNASTSRERRYSALNVTARWLPNKSIWHIANTRMLTSLNNIPIDICAVESVISTLAGVKACLVVCHQKCLVAFYIPEKNAMNGNQVKYELCQRLPTIMIPERFISVDEFPKSMGGIIDRQLLLERSLSNWSESQHLTSFEAKILNLWQIHFQVGTLEVEENIFQAVGNRKPVTFWYEAASWLWKAVKKYIQLDKPEPQPSVLFRYPSVRMFCQYLAED